MKKIEAIIRMDKLEDLKEALTKENLAKGMTISQVLGHGKQKGFAENVRGKKIVPTLLSKIKVEMIINNDLVDTVIEIIMKTVATGEIGDGKIFIFPVEDAIRIRTGERGEEAL